MKNRNELNNEALSNISGGDIYADRMAGKFYVFNGSSNELVGIYSSILEAQWWAKNLGYGKHLMSKSDFEQRMSAQ